MGKLTFEQVHEQVTSAVLEIFEDSLGKSVYLDDQLEDLNLDSLDLVEMTMEIEQHFNLAEIDTDEVENCDTVADLINLVSDKVHF